MPKDKDMTNTQEGTETGAADTSAEVKGVDEAPSTEATVAQLERMSTNQVRKGRWVRIVLASGQEEAERAPVPIAVNGYQCLLKRDEEGIIPESLLNVLEDAVETRPVVVEEGGSRKVTWKKIKRFSYMVVGTYDTKAEAEAAAEAAKDSQ